MAKFSIERLDSGPIMSLGAMPVFVNGQKVGGLRRGQTLTFDFEGESAQVQLGAWPQKSKAVTVSANQLVGVEVKAASFLLPAFLALLGIILGAPLLRLFFLACFMLFYLTLKPIQARVLG